MLRLSNWIKRTLIILGMLLGLSPIAFADTNLERGTYTLTNNVTHDNAVGQGMARSYTEEQSDLVVSKDGLWFTLGFNNTNYMGEFTIKVNGSQVSYDVVYNSNNIKKLKFKIPSIDAKISVGMYVVPMDTTVEYTVTLNQGSLKLIEKEAVEEVKPEEPVKQPESNTGNSTQPDNNTTVTKPSVPSTSTPSASAPSTSKPSTSTQTGSSSNSNAQSSASGTTSQAAKPEATVTQLESGTEEQTQAEETGSIEETVEATEEAEVVEVEELTEEVIAEGNEEALDLEGISETEQEASEDAAEKKGSFTGMIIAVIMIGLALAGGLYYWYSKTRK